MLLRSPQPMTPHMIFNHTQCRLGEGPLWHPLRQELWWFDILTNRLLSKNQIWDLAHPGSAAGWVTKSEILLADAVGLHLFNLETGARETVADLEASSPITRSNDGRADPWGGFWIGTMGHNAEPNAGAIYRYYKGELRMLFAGLSIPNAISFAPSGSHACFCDSTKRQIMRQTLDGKTGWPKGEPELYLDFSNADWNPDGAVIDTNGNFWNAQWGAARVAGFDPSGKQIEKFTFPGHQTSCPAFGGENFQTLYCTSAADGLIGDDEGKTFALQTHYTGQAEHQVIL